MQHIIKENLYSTGLSFDIFLHSDDYNKILKSHGNVETMIFFKLKIQNSKGLQERKRCVSGKKHSYCW